MEIRIVDCRRELLSKTHAFLLHVLPGAPDAVAAVRAEPGPARPQPCLWQSSLFWVHARRKYFGPTGTQGCPMAWCGVRTTAWNAASPSLAPATLSRHRGRREKDCLRQSWCRDSFRDSYSRATILFDPLVPSPRLDDAIQILVLV